MSEKQKQLITIIRLFDLTQSIVGIILTVVFLLYTLMFGTLGLAATSSSSSSNLGPTLGIVFIIVFGGIALISGIMTGLNILLALKLEEPKKWIWTTQVVMTCLQFLNLYYLPVNVYFLIQLLKPEYKEYYNE